LTKSYTFTLFVEWYKYCYYRYKKIDIPTGKGTIGLMREREHAFAERKLTRRAVNTM